MQEILNSFANTVYNCVQADSMYRATPESSGILSLKTIVLKICVSL